MYNVVDFVRWALAHVKRETIPEGATLPLRVSECGIEPWQYLFGSVKVRTTDAMLDYYFNHHYVKQMTRAQYDSITRDWDRNGYATDCQGLCDAYWTHVLNTPTDINADMNYRLWCDEKGAIKEIDRPYVVGEALFIYKASTGKMTHVGWICGFDRDGQPLVVEAKGIRYGVVITKVSNGSWTHRGLMTKVFDYTVEQEEEEETQPVEKVKFEKTSPMQKGDAFLAMQKALNLAGYTDDDGNPLDEDSKWGTKSQQAFMSLIADYSVVQEPAEEIPGSDDAGFVKPVSTFTLDADDGKMTLVLALIEKNN